MPKLIEFTCKPERDFPVPYSDGYSLYSALLNQMSNYSPEKADMVHDSGFSSISVSGLNGSFGGSERDNYKKLSGKEEYTFKVGVTAPEEKEVFQALIGPMVLEEEPIQLSKGELNIREVESHSRSFNELVSESKEDLSKGVNSVGFEFTSPACIQYANSSVTEMFPHRIEVFNSVAGKWNQVCPEGMEVKFKKDDFGRNLIEKPVPESYQTHSVLVNRVYDENKGHRRPIFRQGFTGKCNYSFSGQEDAGFKEKVVTLARFSEYSGVGSAVARGCGSVRAKIFET